MNIDKMIDFNIIRLSSKYKISIVETRKYNEELKRVTKSYVLNYQDKKENSYNNQEYFKNKREIASWLACQN
jgi:hypothetical protein